VQINPKEERILEDGWYPATIDEVEEKDTKFGDRLMVPFIVEDDGSEVEITAFISFSDHPKSNVVKWGKALFGNRPFDTDEFSGQTCEVFVEEGEDSDGQQKNFVRKLRPRKDGGKAKAKGKPKLPTNPEFEEAKRKREAARDGDVEDDFDDLPL
jgi:hypothetical protein